MQEKTKKEKRKIVINALRGQIKKGSEKMSINNNENLKKIMPPEDYTKYLNAIDFEDFYQIEKILKKYKFKMVIK